MNKTIGVVGKLLINDPPNKSSNLETIYTILLISNYTILLKTPYSSKNILQSLTFF